MVASPFSRKEIDLDCRMAIQEVRVMFKVDATIEWHFLGMLDAVLQVYHEDYWKYDPKPQAHELDETVRMFGVYLGEMIRNRKGTGVWMLDRSNTGLRIYLDLGKELDPIERVRLRIIEGEKFEVMSFANEALE